MILTVLRDLKINLMEFYLIEMAAIFTDCHFMSDQGLHSGRSESMDYTNMPFTDTVQCVLS